MENRTKLRKNLFMTLKPGQCIMANNFEMSYEVITDNLEDQWEEWRKHIGLTVSIFDSEDECLKYWWLAKSGLKRTDKSKAIFHEKLSKKLFIKIPDNYFILFCQYPFDYFELNTDREKQWIKYRHKNGSTVMVFKTVNDCIFDRNNIVSLFPAR